MYVSCDTGMCEIQLCHSLLEKCEQRGSGRKVSLDIFLYGNMIHLVPRASTTLDCFNAVAEARRREILVFLATRARAVGEIVDALEMPQPSVSPHLGVLRKVGLVRSRRHGREVLYQTNADGIRPLYEWTKSFEALWRHQLLRMKDRAEAAAKTEKPKDK